MFTQGLMNKWLSVYEAFGVILYFVIVLLAAASFAAAWSHC